MRAQRTSGARPPGSPGWLWWRRGRERKASAGEASYAEAERLLDLAGFSDGRLGDDKTRRIAALIARDPHAAADVAVARSLSGVAAPPADDWVIARAVALVDERKADGAGEYGRVLSFPLRPPAPPVWRGATAWSSLAAAIALASWLGFDLGSGVSLLRPLADSNFEDAATGGVLDPAPPLVRDFTEGWQT
jgi:hypothetical protein